MVGDVLSPQRLWYEFAADLLLRVAVGSADLLQESSDQLDAERTSGHDANTD